MKIMVIVLFLLTASSQATAANYGFDGTLTDHFSPVPDNVIPDIDPLPQAGGVLNYHNGGVTSEPEHAIALLSKFSPTYNQSWTASIDVTVPSSYDDSYFDGPGDDYLGAGIGIFFDFSGEFPGLSFSSSMEVDATGHLLLSDTNLGGVNRVQDETTATNATFTLSFDSATKTLSSITEEGLTQLSIDIDAPGTDWGMTDTDQFSIFLFGNSGNEAVFANDPITLDNFTATIIPEPSALLLGLFGLVCIGNVSARAIR